MNMKSTAFKIICCIVFLLSGCSDHSDIQSRYDQLTREEKESISEKKVPSYQETSYQETAHAHALSGSDRMNADDEVLRERMLTFSNDIHIRSAHARSDSDLRRLFDSDLRQLLERRIYLEEMRARMMEMRARMMQMHRHMHHGHMHHDWSR